MALIKTMGVDYPTLSPEQSADEWRNRMLGELEIHVRRMDRACASRQEFWMWFDGEAESLLRGASGEKQHLLRRRVSSLLKRAGIRDRYDS